jgi:hypothetical protein
MRWFRSRVRFGAYLALAALALQFALSFAHVHVPGARPRSATFIALFAVQSTAETGTPSPTPSKPHPKGLLGDACAIRTLIQIAGSAPPAASPPLPLPAASGRVVYVVPAILSLEAVPHTLAQARAPPTA